MNCISNCPKTFLDRRHGTRVVRRLGDSDNTVGRDPHALASTVHTFETVLYIETRPRELDHLDWRVTVTSYWTNLLCEHGLVIDGIESVRPGLIGPQTELYCHSARPSIRSFLSRVYRYRFALGCLARG